ncbi:MAG: hypothetical protein A2020_03280 [Lentisphaerae bacterium GWF2_45_14]|nr:MAG: hypothetical protein A2020_03280 [Lentisphaerae bacterium GWF2_45_14]
MPKTISEKETTSPTFRINWSDAGLFFAALAAGKKEEFKKHKNIRREKMRIQKRKFTIIELLVVIAIIAVLMGMLLPAVTAVRQNARKTRAKSELNAIVTAIKQYEATYGYFPMDTSYDNGEAKYRELFEILTGYDGPDVGTVPNGTTTFGNTRNVRFLDVPSSYGTNTAAVSGVPAAGTYTNPASAAGDYYDPWGSRYMIFVDANYDGVFNKANDYAGSANVLVEGKNGSVFAYSLGADQKHHITTESDTNNKDNIYSWK